jgi:hypothetical protein
MAIRRISNIGGMLTQAGQQQAQMLGQGVGAVGAGVGAGLTSLGQGVLTGIRQREVQQALAEFGNNPAKLDELAAQYAARGETEVANAFTAASKNARLASTQQALQGLDMTDPTSVLQTGRTIMSQDMEAGLGLITKGAEMTQARNTGQRMAKNLTSMYGAENKAAAALAAELKNVTTSGALDALRQPYIEQMTARLPKTGRNARFQIASGVVPNLTQAKFEELDLANFSEEGFTQWAAGQEGGEIAAWQYKDADNNLDIKAFRTGNGLVYVDGQWVTPEDAGLIQEAPESQVISQAASSFEDEIIKKNAENFFDLHQQAKESSSALAGLDEVIGMIDRMPTGAFADTKADLIRYFKQIGLDLEPEFGNIEDYQQFEAAAGRRVASYIKTLGSGNGITDKDLEFTLKVVGASAALEPGSLKRILQEFQAGNIKKIKDYNDIRTKTATALDKRSTGSSELSMSSFQLIPLPSTGGFVIGPPVPVEE